MRLGETVCVMPPLIILPIYIRLSLLSSNLYSYHVTDLGSVINLNDGSLQHNVCPLRDGLMGTDEVLY